MKIQKLPLVGYIYSSIILNVLTAVIVGVVKGNLPPVIPLFYGKPVGADQLVPTLGLLIAPAVAIVITIINAVLATNLKDDYLKRILAVSSLFIALLSTITVVKIIFLIGFW